MLSEYKQDRILNKQLEQENKSLSDKLQQALFHSETQEKESEQLKTKLQEQNEKFKITIQESNTKHQDELTNLHNKLELEKNRCVLGLQQEQQGKLQEIQNKHIEEMTGYQSKLREIQNKHIEEIEFYQTKYKELLDKL